MDRQSEEDGRDPFGPQAPGQPPVRLDQQGQGSSDLGDPAKTVLVFGVLSIVLCFMPLFGVVFGVLAVVKAGKSIKESGSSSKATVGRVCGIIGVAASALVFVLYICLAASGVLRSIEQRASLVQSASPPAALVDKSEAGTSDAEQQAKDAVAASFDKLKNGDAATIQGIGGDFNAAFRGASGYNLADLGIDPSEFVRWSLTDFSYSVESAGMAKYGTTGYVLGSVAMRDLDAFVRVFAKDLQNCTDSGELGSLPDEAAVLAKMGELFRGAMVESTSDAKRVVSVSVSKTGDSWVVDDDSWNGEMKYLFGF